MARIGFVTTSSLSEMPVGDALTAAALKNLGHSVHPVPWDAEGSADGVDILVFRSCWNYHRRPDQFSRWVDQQHTEGRKLFNPRNTILWNIDKRYLIEIATQVPIVPTEVIVAPCAASIKAACANRGWTRAIVKPSVGATAYQARRLLTARDFEALGNERLPDVALVQPYISEIERRGEFSLIFFGAAYSHAVVKLPSPGDYRVQQEFGGSVRVVEPPAEVMSVALGVIDFLSTPPIYARVDIVAGSEGAMLMELELIEPELFLDRAQEAPARFALAIHTNLG